MSVNDVPIVALGVMAALSMAATIAIFWIGLFALLSGRDTVWECSWRWPGRLLAGLYAIGEIPIILSFRSAFARFVAGERVFLQVSGADRLRTAASIRRPTSQHYLTVGARTRMATNGTRSARHAA